MPSAPSSVGHDSQTGIALPVPPAEAGAAPEESDSPRSPGGRASRLRAARWSRPQTPNGGTTPRGSLGGTASTASSSAGPATQTPVLPNLSTGWQVSLCQNVVLHCPTKLPSKDTFVQKKMPRPVSPDRMEISNVKPPPTARAPRRPSPDRSPSPASSPTQSPCAPSSPSRWSGGAGRPRRTRERRKARGDQSPPPPGAAVAATGLLGAGVEFAAAAPREDGLTLGQQQEQEQLEQGLDQERLQQLQLQLQLQLHQQQLQQREHLDTRERPPPSQFAPPPEDLMAVRLALERSLASGSWHAGSSSSGQSLDPPAQPFTGLSSGG